MLHHTHLKFKEELSILEDSVQYLILHHSEVISRHTVEDIHRWHQKRKWAGIGYHFFVSKEGEIYECRPLWAKGAHAYGYNAKSIGICFEGDFNKEMMSDKQENAAVMLLALLNLSYEDSEIICHSSLVNNTNCPGKNFPFNSLLAKVECCKNWLKSLFGEEQSEWVMDSESRNRYVGLDEKANQERQNMSDLFETGFDYSKIINMLKETE